MVFHQLIPELTPELTRELTVELTRELILEMNPELIPELNRKLTPELILEMNPELIPELILELNTRLSLKRLHRHYDIIPRVTREVHMKKGAEAPSITESRTLVLDAPETFRSVLALAAHVISALVERDGLVRVVRAKMFEKSTTLLDLKEDVHDRVRKRVHLDSSALHHVMVTRLRVSDDVPIGRVDRVAIDRGRDRVRRERAHSPDVDVALSADVLELDCHN
jgi:hypothetical protein